MKRKNDEGYKYKAVKGNSTIWYPKLNIFNMTLLKMRGYEVSELPPEMPKPKYDDDKVMLMPCPMCGKGVDLIHLSDNEWMIGCKNENCILWTGAVFETKEAAIKAWNTRVTVTSDIPKNTNNKPRNVDKAFKNIGFIKVKENKYGVTYEKKTDKYIHVIDIMDKSNGRPIVQSYDKGLMDIHKIGNTCVGLTYYEMKLIMQKMEQLGYDKRRKKNDKNNKNK